MLSCGCTALATWPSWQLVLWCSYRCWSIWCFWRRKRERIEQRTRAGGRADEAHSHSPLTSQQEAEAKAKQEAEAKAKLEAEAKAKQSEATNRSALSDYVADPFVEEAKAKQGGAGANNRSALSDYAADSFAEGQSILQDVSMVAPDR
jgi:hypothetical protein